MGKFHGTAVVYDLTTKEELTPDDVAKVNELIRLLKQKERSLEKRLAHDPMTVDTAKSLLEETCGLLRAIEELRSAETQEKAEFKKSEVMSRIEDAKTKRWQKFVEAIKPSSACPSSWAHPWYFLSTLSILAFTSESTCSGSCVARVLFTLFLAFSTMPFLSLSRR